MMEARIATSEEYARLFPDGAHTEGAHLYNSVAFTELMHDAAGPAGPEYIIIGDSKPRLGIVVGMDDGELVSPFSAPFGSVRIHGTPSTEIVDEAIAALKRLKPGLVITIPPQIYGERVYAMVAGALLRHGTLRYTDINYHYPLERLEDKEAYMARNARKNLHNALRVGFELDIIDSSDPEAVKRAYDVIKANREARNHPLRMSYEHVLRTIPIADTRFAVMRLGNDDVAAAQVQRSKDDIGHVVYWGDAPGYSHLRPMNLFPFILFEYCRDLGFKTMDIGKSSVVGVPDYGLCRFKESLGCSASLQPTFLL